MKPILKIFLVTLFAVNFLSINAQEKEKRRSSIIEEIGQKKFYIHLVQPGEDIEQVAELYETTVDEIYNSTPDLFKGSEIEPNHILRIPFQDSEGPKRRLKVDSLSFSFEKSIQTRLPDERKERELKEAEKDKKSESIKIHKVKPEETLFSLSRKYNVSLQDIHNSNPGLTSDLSIGQKLRIPMNLAKANRSEKENQEKIFKGTSFSYYTVKPKETVYRIAKNFGISQNELIRMNPKIRTEGLKAREKIRIPHSADEDIDQDDLQGNLDHFAEKDSIETVRRYKVKFLERLPGISKREDVTLEDIYRLNPGIKEKGVSWGDIIKLPRKALVIEQVEKESGVDYITHKVSKNETLYSIARLYNIPQEDIIALNPGSGRVIKRGQVLKIPVKVPETEEEIIDEKTPEDTEEEELPKKEMEVICQQRDASSEVFEVALMIPFFLEDYQSLDTTVLTKGKPNFRSHSFIQFYEGAMLALDTLKKQGMNVELFVYDLGKTREEAIASLDQNLEQVDLIIGPIYRDAFNEVKRFANHHQIKIVNPLSSRDSITYNAEGVFKVQAPEEAELNDMAKFINKYYKDTTSIFIVRDNQYQEADKLKHLRAAFDKMGIANTDKQKIHEVVYYSDSLHPVLDSTKWGNKNIVVGLSNQEVFTIEFVRHMNEMHDSIPNVTLFGLSQWRSFNLTYDHLNNLDVHLFDDGFVDYDSDNVNHFVRMFREWYFTEPLPEKFAFEGYDITYYFLSALYKYGTDFEGCLKYHHPELLQYQFKFEEDDNGSYVNKRVIPLKYNSYQLRKDDRPVIRSYNRTIEF